MTDKILALDFGGTKLTAAAVTPNSLTADKPLWDGHRRVPAPDGADADTDIQTMIQLGRDLLGDDAPLAVGVSFGGPADHDDGLVRLSHHVPGWENTPLQALLSDEFNAPTRIDNDANAAALGEHRFGAGRPYDSLLYITVSTGVGGGWILNGRPWRGHENMAGEIGHNVVYLDGPICLCGKRGCIERYASGPYMAHDLQIRYQRNGIESDVPLTGKIVADRARQGDPHAAAVLEWGAWALGVGIGSAANLINPGCFILGGGVTKSGPGWWEMIRRTARTIALPEIHFDILPAALGDDAPLWGAAVLAWEIID